MMTLEALTETVSAAERQGSASRRPTVIALPDNESDMGASSAVTLYGSYAGYAVAVLAVLVTTILVAGFRQGREINFWPPRVGPRPRTEDERAQETSEVSPDSPGRAALNARTQGRAAREFGVCDARQF